MAYQLIQVLPTDKRLIKAFLELPVRLYAGNPYWIRPLDKDIEEVFDLKKNKTFRHGDCIRWVLQDKKGLVIGRVAAFYDKRLFAKDHQPTGGMGFFECINDQTAANQLLDACKAWLQSRDLAETGVPILAMDGPVNFGGRDRWWGLLLDGELPPNFGMFYHHAYYQDLLSSYGMRIYFKQFTFGRQVAAPMSPVVWEKAQRIRQNPDYTFRMLDLKRLEDFTEYFRTIYNAAWVKHSGVGEMTTLQAKATMKALKPVLEPSLLWFGFYKGEPVSFFIMIPDLNQYFKYLDGKFDLWAKLKFLYHKWRGHCNKMIGVAFGVVPSQQGKGVESAMVAACADVVQKTLPYREFEMIWIGSFNPKMLKVAENVQVELTKTHATFRHLFDPIATPWKDCPNT